jgi:molybdopterin/thiamine biosynthesis adenylyltransferase
MQTTTKTKNVFWRQIDILSPDKVQGFALTLIGTGGIGSITAMILAKMGVRVFDLYDPDTVEDHNLPNQMFANDHIGEKKVNAIADLIKDFGHNVDVQVFDRKFGNGDIPNQVTVSGVDSMESRIEIWDKVKKNPNCNLYIDGRMGAEAFIIYALNPNNQAQIERYEKTLHSDEEAAEEICTAKAIAYNVAGIATVIASIIKKYLNKQEFHNHIIMDTMNLEISKGTWN